MAMLFAMNYEGDIVMKIRYFMSEAITSFYRNSFMSIASIISVALSFFILGLFVILVSNLDNFAGHLENQVQISVYLKEGLTTEQVMGVGKRLKSLPDIRELKFTNKDQAMVELKERMKDQPGILEALEGKNPLPTSYEITFTNAEAVKKTAALVATYPEVESSHYGQDVIEQLLNITKVIRWGGIAIIIILTVATLFIISNTIRLTVFARRKEIGIMKYVGATNWFIRWPFLLEGLLLGLIGGVIADVALFQFYRFVTSEIQRSLAFLPLVSMNPFMYYIGGGLLVLSMLIGAIGSTISLKRYMKV